MPEYVRTHYIVYSRSGACIIIVIFLRFDKKSHYLVYRKKALRVRRCSRNVCTAVPRQEMFE